MLRSKIHKQTLSHNLFNSRQVVDVFDGESRIDLQTREHGNAGRSAQPTSFCNTIKDGLSALCSINES